MSAGGCGWVTWNPLKTLRRVGLRLCGWVACKPLNLLRFGVAGRFSISPYGGYIPLTPWDGGGGIR